MVFLPSGGGPRQYIPIGESCFHVYSVGHDFGAPRHGYLSKNQSFLSNYAFLSYSLFSSTRIASYYFISHTCNRD